MEGSAVKGCVGERGGGVRMRGGGGVGGEAGMG